MNTKRKSAPWRTKSTQWILHQQVLQTLTIFMDIPTKKSLGGKHDKFFFVKAGCASGRDF